MQDQVLLPFQNPALRPRSCSPHRLGSGFVMLTPSITKSESRLINTFSCIQRPMVRAPCSIDPVCASRELTTTQPLFDRATRLHEKIDRETGIATTDTLDLSEVGFPVSIRPSPNSSRLPVGGRALE
jgi:hypothetical protein